ncbi:MAG: hypothetical protein QOF84_2026 [Streptomyces sp.]|nr:hypothetical protein [Streptomyces sp.]
MAQTQEHETEFTDPALQPEQAAHLTRTLRKAADSGLGGPDLQDVARKLLSGRVELRDVLDSPAGARAFGAGLEPLRSKWEALSAEERQAIRDGSAEQPESDAPRTDDDAAKPRSRRPRGQAPGSPAGGHTSGGWSLY